MTENFWRWTREPTSRMWFCLPLSSNTVHWNKFNVLVKSERQFKVCEKILIILVANYANWPWKQSNCSKLTCFSFFSLPVGTLNNESIPGLVIKVTHSSWVVLEIIPFSSPWIIITLAENLWNVHFHLCSFFHCAVE